MIRHRLCGIISLMVLVSFTSCDGVFNNLYDDEVPSVQTGMSVGKLSINASEYSQWVYINFHNRTIENIDITTDSVTGVANFTEPEEWDIAIHKFQVKTNNGTAIETEYTSIADLKSAGKLPDVSFAPDTWYEEKVIIDLSGMMSGNIKYCASYVNDVIDNWITSSGMPPTYTTSDKVYVVRFADGSDVAIHFDSYMNNDGTKGFITCSYEYPLTF